MSEYRHNPNIQELAHNVVVLSRNTLLVNLRFLDAALSQFSLKQKQFSFATDGRSLFYTPRHVLLRYKKEKESITRDYLHLVLHCIFRHMYIHTLVDQTLWNLACDIAVENVINDLGLSCVTAQRQFQQGDILGKLRGNIKQVTAEKVYKWYLDHPPKDLDVLTGLFYADDHAPWYRLHSTRAEDNEQSGNGQIQKEIGVEVGVATKASNIICDSVSENGCEFQNCANQKTSESSDRDNTCCDGIEQTWKDISEHVQMDLDIFSKQHGRGAGSLMQNLKAVNREQHDYTAFLKRFAVQGEIMKLNPEEFDYIFYTYGLQVYKNMPLIESLEYRDVRRIREFVIAIDTSGSVAGVLVQKFIQKTYNILKQEESFFSKINLHILQCDAQIQEDVKITSQKEFDEYLTHITLRGFGGTDFRPVFQYVDGLRKSREFINLTGLIYFTDGNGDFPEQPPDYRVAFAFVNDEDNVPILPSWAIKLVLRPDEIEKF